jgi:superfamily I DNA/RNA helicase/RecB family exonuclease
MVVGGPGTGKTEFLVRRAVYLIEQLGVRPESIVVLGFSRRAVAEVRNRIREALAGSIGPLDVATFHSYSARLLEQQPNAAGWEENPQILTGPEQVALIQDLLSTEDVARWSPAFGDLLRTRTFAREVTEFVLRASEQLKTPADVAATERADWRGLPGFLDRYARMLRLRGRIDYGTLISTAVALVEDHRSDTGSARYVLVDEYQDTTTAQVRLVQALQNAGSEILVAADPYQSIYSFRGASLENVASFETDFGGATPASRLLLTTSFRTPAAILETSVAVTTGDLPGATGAVHPAAGKGVVEAYLFDQQVEEAEWIAAEAQRLHLTQQVPYGRIGVFVRSKRRLLADLSRSLERRHIPHDLPGSRLSDQPAVRFVLDLAVAATSCDGPLSVDQAMRRVLLGRRVGLTIGAYRSLERRAAGLGSWSAAIREQIPEWSAMADLVDDPTWADEVPAAQGLWRIWTDFPGIERMVADPAAGEERAAWRSFAQVLNRWEDRNPAGTLLDYRDLADSEEFEAEPLLSYRRLPGDRLALTTLHQAKGLELDVVFVADAVDGVFPDLRTRDSLLGVRHLLPHVPTDTAAYRTFRLQEESRLAYTAMTRARRRVVWTATARGLDDGPGRPSRFFTRIAEFIDVRPARPTRQVTFDPTDMAGRPPVTPSEAEAALRRTMLDVASPPPRRLAALTTLAEGARWGLRSPTEFHGVPERGSNRGLISADHTLSPSQAQSYEDCPRRYVLERRLRIGSDRSVYANFGTLIHEVLDAAETAAIAYGAAYSTIEDALRELDRLFDPDEFGGSPFAESWRDRAEAGLTKLYANWPAPGRPARLLEHQLDTTIDGVRWTGRADRIDGGGTTGLTIVDYKTSTQALTGDEAAKSLQLGYYVLAATQDAEVGRIGSVIGAEFWYPMTATKSIATRSFDMAKLNEVEARLQAVATGIRDEEWTPRPGTHCERCSLRSLCPAWTEGGPAFS